jgi:SH3 domain-containing YSC84-like protein 1
MNFHNDLDWRLSCENPGMARRISGLFLAAALPATVLLAQEQLPDSRLHNTQIALGEIMRSPDRGIPRDLIDKAQCIVIVPDLFKAAFLVGGKYGRGYAMCRHGAGWSSPAGMRIEGGSFGFQLGGSATDLVMLVMNHHGMERLLGDKFTLGGEATAAAGPVGRDTTAQTDLAMHAEILSWSRSRGLFAGISLDGATLRPDNGENRKLYGRAIHNREILEVGVPTPAGARPLVAELDRISTGGPVEARLRAPGGRVILGEDQIRFATGAYDVPAGAEPALSQVATTLTQNPSWHVRIEGFTDNVGSRESNRALSNQRAQAVMNWLTGRGVNPAQMSARGYGESHPIATNHTEDGRARNRRVEIVREGSAPIATGF